MERRMKYVENLAAIGATTKLCEYLADVLHCESDMMQIMGKYLVEINYHFSTKCTIDELCNILQGILKSILTWKNIIDDLEERKVDLPQNLDVDRSKLEQIHTFKAICSIETSKTSLKEGENVEITDSSYPGLIKVKNADGREGYLPLLSCFIPSPDLDISNCTERLRINLVTCASDLLIKLQSMLSRNLLIAFEDLIAYLDLTFVSYQSKKVINKFKARSQLGIGNLKEGKLQLKHLARSLRNLENEFIRISLEDTEEVCLKISTIDKTILYFLALRDNLLAYRAEMKTGYRPIRIVQLDDQAFDLNRNKMTRCYEVCLTFKETTIREEHSYYTPRKDQAPASVITEFNGDSKSNRPIKSGSSKHSRVQSVVHPWTGEDISIKEAVSLGILDHRSSLYVNLKTGEKISMPVAISKGLIKMIRRGDGLYENANETKNVSNNHSAEQHDDSIYKSSARSQGLITLKTRVVKAEYEILSVLDRANGIRVDASKAANLGIIKDGFFLDSKDGSKISLDRAIHHGWVEVNGWQKAVNSYDEDQTQTTLYDEHEETYAIESVYDRSADRFISFHEAIKRHLVDPLTSCIIDSITNEKVFPREAIERGLIKAIPVDTPSALQVYGGLPVAPSSASHYLKMSPSIYCKSSIK